MICFIFCEIDSQFCAIQKPTEAAIHQNIFSLLLHRGAPFSSRNLDGFNVGDIIDSCGHTPLVLVRNFTDRSTQNLTAASLRELFHEDDANQAGKGSNILAYFVINLLFESLLLEIGHVLGSLALKNDKGKRTLASDFLVEADDGAFDNF